MSTKFIVIALTFSAVAGQMAPASSKKIMLVQF